MDFFFFFTLFRASVFALWSVYVAKTFGGAKIGTILGISYALGGLINFAMPPITQFVLVGLGGDWDIVSWVMLVTALGQGGAVFWLEKALSA